MLAIIAREPRPQTRLLTIKAAPDHRNFVARGSDVRMFCAGIGQGLHRAQWMTIAAEATITGRYHTIA